MNKTDLIYSVAKKCEFSRKDTRKVVDIIIDSIIRSLGDGEKVQIEGLGNFETRNRTDRKGTNPQTGERIFIPAARYAVFSPSKELKDALQQKDKLKT